jgi:hypothetical protein
MRNFHSRLPFSLQALCVGVVVTLMITYIGLIAVVMNYAAATVTFSQSVRDDESAVAILEGQYLIEVARITAMNYTTAGYALPNAKIFVPAKSATALRY